MFKFLRTILLGALIGGAVLPLVASAARTQVDWVNLSGTTYIQPNFGASGMDLLILGSSRYINFNTVTGTSGYGIRDNGGTIECKNSGGSWSACQDGTGGGGGTYPFFAFTTFSTTTSATSSSITTKGAFFASSTVASQFPYASSTALTAGNLFATTLAVSGSATTTFANGIDLSSGIGCFSINGTCLQTIISSASAYKQAVTYASTSTLPANTYNNGTGGVGATITETGNGPLFIDGNTTVLGQRILVKNEATGANNGIYTVTTLGIASVSPFVLTRATDYNSNADVFPGVANFTNSGTVNANTCWILTNTSAVTIGTTALTYADECGAGSFTASYPILLSGTTFSFGGLTTTTPWTNGQLAMVQGLNQVTSVATTTLTGTAPIAFSQAISVIGGSPSVITCATATASVAGCESPVNFSIFTNKVATSAVPTIGNLAMWTGAFPATIGNVATGTLAATAPITVTAGQAIIGSGATIACTAASASVAGCLAAADFVTFMAKPGDSFPTHTSYAGQTTSGTSSTLWLTGTVKSLAATSSDLTYASTTMVTFTTASTTNLVVSSISGTAANCLQASSIGVISGTGSGCTGSAANPGFTFSTIFGTVNTAATTSQMQITGGLAASSTIRFGNAGVIGQVLYDAINGWFGLASTTPTATLSVGGGTSPSSVLFGGGTASSSVIVGAYDYGLAGRINTSTVATIGPDTSPTVQWPMGGAATTLTLCNFTYSGQTFNVVVVNPNGTAGALTFAACSGTQLYWSGAGSTAPAQTTTANAWTFYTFKARRSYSPASSTSAWIVTGAAVAGL